MKIDTFFINAILCYSAQAFAGERDAFVSKMYIYDGNLKKYSVEILVKFD